MIMVIDMKKNNKGFTLIELLAVIVILGVIMVIATTNVIKSINTSKEKAKYIAAKDIVQIAEAYFATNSTEKSVKISELSAYLESDATNPKTGENNLLSNGSNQVVCRNEKYLSKNQDGYTNNGGKGYEFDGYWYGIEGTCK